MLEDTQLHHPYPHQTRRRRRRRPPAARLDRSDKAPRGFQLAVFLRQVSEALTRVERAARELRGVADSATNVLQRTRDPATDPLAAAQRLRDRAFRLHKTGSMLAQLVLGYRLFGLRSALSSPERTHAMLEQLHRDNARRFRDTSREQGGAFLKVGQLLSARADVLPRAWIQELESLQDAVPPIPDHEARQALRAALGGDPEQCFERFDWQPLAAASIGQVHRARTLDGVDVAVKLQRPGIAARIEDDLSLLSLSCEALRSSLPPLDLDTIVQQITMHVRAEVDYEREARLGARVAEFFANVEGISVPQPLPELCRRELLTTQYVPGRKLTVELDELRAARDAGDTVAQARLSQLLGRLLEAYLRQMFELGTFQADPHPGNLLVTPSGELVILDFGCAGELTPEVRRAYLSLLAAFFMNDREGAAEALATLGFRTQSGQPDGLIGVMQGLLGQLAQAVTEGRVDWQDSQAATARLKQLGQLLAADPVVCIPEHFVMIGRVLGTLVGLFAHYAPDLDVAKHVLPVLALV